MILIFYPCQYSNFIVRKKPTVTRQKLISKFLFFVILIIFLVFPVSNSQVHGQEKGPSLSPTMIIHQIRGSEVCCVPGNIQMIETLSKNTSIWSLPLSWALRFDALKDESYIGEIKKLPKNHSLGLLLEVTPKLASESGVLYKSDPAGSDWREGRSGLLVGYIPSERKKIIDTVFKLFHQHFGYFPTFTVSWMIDSWSLSYMRDTYGIRVHELTKEQFETDSYTLYGGIFNLPYFPSRYHPLVPAKNFNESLDLMIVRQTVSDISRNYGSYESFYTSQPNDYLSGDLSNFTYFTKLLEESMSQNPGSRFALLGLENSSEWDIYKDEYQRQLDHVSKKSIASELRVVKPYDFYLEQKINEKINPARILKNIDFPQSGAWWYFGSTYRARLEMWDGSLYLTDLRIYPDALVDPYQNEPVTTSRSYWILPYLIDSSQQFTTKLGQEKINQGFPVRNDDMVSRFGIRLLESVTNISDTDEYTLIQGKGEEIKFTPLEVMINSKSLVFGHPYNIDINDVMVTESAVYMQFPQHPRFVIMPQKGQKSLQLGWENEDKVFVQLATLEQSNNSWLLRPRTDISKEELQSLSMIFQPDKSSEKLDLAKTVIYWHNTESIVGRGPVRLYIDPRNSLDRQIPIGNLMIKLNDNSSIDVKLPFDVTSRMEPFFVDFISNQPISDQVRLMIGENLVPEVKIVRFYPDCRMQFFNCLKNKDDLVGFSRIYVKDIFQEVEKKLRIIWIDVRMLVEKKIAKLLQHNI